MCRNTQSSAVNSAAPVLGTSPGASFPAGTSPGSRPRRGHAYSPGSQQPSKWFVQVSTGSLEESVAAKNAPCGI